MGPTLNTSFPSRCRHCDPAPCQQVCPTGAIYRDSEEGLVLLDAAKCIACAMCAIVCPFDAVTFHPVTGNGNGAVHPLAAVKCDGCIERVRHGEEPACVEVCKTDALVYGELNELAAAGRVGAAAKALSATAAIEPDGGFAADNVAAWRSFGTELKELESRES
jgi:carbon-monoxide dehydrogenase iron sulfur subunit